MRVFLFSALCMLVLAASIVVSKSTATMNENVQEPRRVSIVALIAFPRQYDNVRVSVSGYLDLAYESDAVYLHEEDFRHGMTRNGLKLVLQDGQRERFKRLSHRYVIVEGTFTADDSQGGMFSGHIIEVTRMQELQTEEEFLRRPSNSAKP